MSKKTNLMILENSKIVEEKLFEWKKFIDESGEEIDFEDYQLLTLTEGEYRELESKAKKVLEYVGSAFFGGVGIFAMYLYRRATDECRNNCSDAENKKSCKYNCYAEACQKTIDRIKKEAKGKMKEIESEKKKEKAKEKLNKQVEKWQKKKEKYLKKAKKAGNKNK